MSCERCGSQTTRPRFCRECALLVSVENEAEHRDAPPLYECNQCGEERAESPDSTCWLCRSDRHEVGDDGRPEARTDGGSDGSSVTTPQDLPDWVPEEYEPEAPLAERVPIMAEIDGGIELHVRDGERDVVEIVGSPYELSENGAGTMTLKCGANKTTGDTWSWEIVVPEDGEARLMDVDPMQSMDAYMKTKKEWLSDVDVRIYGVDADRFVDPEVEA